MDNNQQQQQPVENTEKKKKKEAPVIDMTKMGDVESQKTMALLAHILGILTSFVAPLVLYLTAEESKPWVKLNAKDALNFQLTMLIGYVVGMILTTICIGVILMMAAGILSLIFGIMAALKVNKNQYYKYPICIKFIK